MPRRTPFAQVRFLKVAFPLAAIAGAGLLAAATILRPKSSVDISTDSVSLSDGRIVMANPKLDGLTGDKRPYAMKADRAFQEIGRDGLVELEKITAQLPFGTNSTAQCGRAAVFSIMLGICLILARPSK